MTLLKKLTFSCPLISIFSAFLFSGCTVERAEETIIATHAGGAKKTSIWVYPDGEILKRNEWYTDGIKELEIPYKNNEPHGEFKRWTGFGDLAMTGEYKQGKRHGKWTSFYSATINTKKIEAVRYYKDDHPVGDWEGWHYNENKAFEEHYDKNGDSVGVWKKWNKDGSIAEENSCFQKEENGISRTYNFKGILEREHRCKFGIKDGESIEYYSDGKKVMVREHWTAGKLNGPREIFRGDGLLQKREFWKNNVRDSIWEWFDANGIKISETIFDQGARTDFGIRNEKIYAESTFVQNEKQEFVLNGLLWRMRDDKPLRYEEFWQSGDILESRSFYPDSIRKNNESTTNDSVVYNKLASQGFWKNGKPHGIWRNWYKSGILRDSLTYVNGERVGEQFSYDSTGKLTIHKTENGKNRPVIMHLIQQ